VSVLEEDVVVKPRPPEGAVPVAGVEHS
jgi:hypothetical protein